MSVWTEIDKAVADWKRQVAELEALAKAAGWNKPRFKAPNLWLIKKPLKQRKTPGEHEIFVGWGGGSRGPEAHRRGASGGEGGQGEGEGRQALQAEGARLT